MTTATFVPESDEFDLHTPSLEATKWWIGDLVRPAERQRGAPRRVRGDVGLTPDAPGPRWRTTVARAKRQPMRSCTRDSCRAAPTTACTPSWCSYGNPLTSRSHCAHPRPVDADAAPQSRRQGPHAHSRSLQDHTPLPGIRVGDIGPKVRPRPGGSGGVAHDDPAQPYRARCSVAAHAGEQHGFNGADNGYLQLSHVRIPRSAAATARPEHTRAGAAA